MGFHLGALFAAAILTVAVHGPAKAVPVQLNPLEFAAFTAGLLSISFSNNGTQNPDGSIDTGSYGFDNVVTASAAPPVTVAEPASLALLSIGLIGLGARQTPQGDGWSLKQIRRSIV